jgi:hypothetical protein
VQQLHLVGFTTDLDSLVFSTRKGAKSGSFVLPLDERLLGLIAEAVRRRKLEGDDIEVPIEIRSPGSLVRRESTLSPREIQDRLRAGRSIAEVAGEAGVDEEWVGRFSAPVEAERLQIVGRARQFVYAKPRRGDSGEALGPSVRWNLADRGVRLSNDEFDGAWSAYQLADHTWMVTFSFVSRKREQSAEWEVDFGVGDVFARNRLASDLGYLEPGRRRRSAASLQPSRPPTKSASGRSSSSSSAADEAAARPALPLLAGGAKSAAKRPAAKKRATAARPVGKKAASKRPATKAAAKRPAAKKRATASRPAAKKAAAKRPAAKKRASASRPAAKKAAALRGATRTGGRAPARALATKRGAARTAGRAPARAAATKRGSSRAASSRGAPPAAIAPSPALEPNELSRRRLQIVTGSPVANRGPRQLGTGRPSTATRPSFGRPATPPATPPSTPPRRPPAATAPPRDPRLDVAPEADTSPEARRAERRRARAEARSAAAGESGPARSGRVSAATLAAGPATRPPAPAGPPPATTRVMRSEAPPEADVPAGDGRVVTIRANRATPPTNEGGEVILPPNRPPLRPAQPASQPKSRRRFGRNNGR